MCHRIVPDDFQSVHPRKHFFSFFTYFLKGIKKGIQFFIFIFFFLSPHNVFYTSTRHTTIDNLLSIIRMHIILRGGGSKVASAPSPRLLCVHFYSLCGSDTSQIFLIFFSLSHTRTLLCKVTPPLSNLLRLPETLWLQLNMLSTK